MKKTLLVCLAFVGIFVAGAVTGGFIAARVVRQVVQKRALMQFNQQQLRHYTEVLDLTPEQREQVRVIILRAVRHIQGLRREVQASTGDMQKEIATVLTPEQRAKFDQILARQHDRDQLWQRWFREQRAGREQPPLLPESSPQAAPSRSGL